jgi:hypothetical protein
MPTNTVQWGISFVALALMCGVVVDALTEILVNDRMVKRARTRKRIAEFFLQGEMYDRFHRWKSLFEQTATGSTFELTRHLNEPESERDYVRFNIVRETAIGIFFKEAGKENFEWMASHDATYYMSGNLFILTIVIWVFETASNLKAFVFLPWVLPLIYVLLGRAINRDLYTDVVIFRFATLFCTEAPKRSDVAASQAVEPASKSRQ